MLKIGDKVRVKFHDLIDQEMILIESFTKGRMYITETGFPGGRLDAIYFDIETGKPLKDLPQGLTIELVATPLEVGDKVKSDTNVLNFTVIGIFGDECAIRTLFSDNGGIVCKIKDLRRVNGVPIKGPE